MSRRAVEPSPLPCPVCQQANPAGTRYCAGCGSALGEQKPSKIHDLWPGDAAEETVLGHSTLVGIAPLEDPPVVPGGEHTLLGAPRPILPSGKPAAAPLATTVTWDGPTVLDGARTPSRAGPLRSSTEVMERELTPVGGHPALPPSVGAEAIEVDEDPDEPLPAITAAPTLPPRRPRPVAHPPNRWRQVLVLGGTAALAALATVVGLSWLDDGFRAELVGDLAVTRTSSGYQVQVGVRTSAPARVSHPGGRTVVDGDAALRFEVEDAAIRLGDNRVVLDVTPGQGQQRTLTLHVMVYYKLIAEESPPAGPVTARLEVQPGWRVELQSPGEVFRRHDGVFALRFGPPAAVIPVRFTLLAPDGERFSFDEALRPVLRSPR